MGNGGGTGPSPSASGSPGGQQGAAPAPAPPTQPQNSATAPCHDCPLQVNKPCDVERFEVKYSGVKHNEDARTDPKTVETRKVRRLEEVSDVKDRDVLRLLQQYDFVIDVLAQPNAPSLPNAEPAEIEVKADYHGRHCSPQNHALILMEDLLEKETQIEYAPGQAKAKLGPHKYHSLMSWIDQRSTTDAAFDSVTSVFGMIRALWDRTDARGISIDAKSCGIRARGDGNAPNRQLRALVRIYRRSKWAVGIKIPPFGAFNDSRAGGWDARGERYGSRSQSASAGFNALSRQTSSEWSGEGALGEYKHTRRTQVGGNVSAYESSRSVSDGSVTRTFKEEYSGQAGREIADTDGSYSTKEIKDRLSYSAGFEFVVIHNETEVKLGEAIEKIKEQINAIIEVIRNIQKLFDKVPKVGWSFSFDVSVFAGTIVLEWGAAYGDPLANGRYLPVAWEVGGRVDIEIISLTLTVGFGVDVRALGTGVFAMISGSLTLKASVGADINIGGDKVVEEIDVAASAECKLSATAGATFLGMTIADAELSVDGGVELREGKLFVSFTQKKFDLTGELWCKQIQLTGHIRRPILRDKHIDPPKIILPERQIHEFQ
ncbi:MAG: hypothetical protein JRI23_01500 [Deltaproteobacteria bacterium]|jgi:hypothetical protein|nr:hypothetical protein [Deltaproteobacteria bacterium]MBW2530137.1 hypothetical protein [Deltaproteobacteria bacterium]